MWWRSAALIALLFAGLSALALAGCGFQPLYGGTTAGGARLAEVMKGVDITPIPGRVGQKLRNELIFTNTGGGIAGPARYRLDITVKESVTDQLVQITGDPEEAARAPMGEAIVADVGLALTALADACGESDRTIPGEPIFGRSLFCSTTSSALSRKTSAVKHTTGGPKAS